MANEPYNPQQLKLFKAYSGLLKVVEDAVRKATTTTIKWFGRLEGEEPRAFCRCLNGGYITHQNGVEIAHLYIEASESPYKMSSEARATNIHNGNVGVKLAGKWVYHPSTLPGKVATTNQTIPSTGSGSSTASSSDTGEAYTQIRTEAVKLKFSLAFLEERLTEDCYKALKERLLRYGKT